MTTAKTITCDWCGTETAAPEYARPDGWINLWLDRPGAKPGDNDDLSLDFCPVCAPGMWDAIDTACDPLNVGQHALKLEDK